MCARGGHYYYYAGIILGIIAYLPTAPISAGQSRNLCYVPLSRFSSLQSRFRVTVKPGLWTLDSGLDWTGLDSLREHADCERIGGPRFFSFFLWKS